MALNFASFVEKPPRIRSAKYQTNFPVIVSTGV